MSSKPSILIVDDNRALVLGAERILQKEGYRVLTAFDGMEGLHKALSEKPDLILLDIIMPRLDGFQVLNSVRKHSNVPVIMFTGVYDYIESADVTALGADACIRKPFLIQDLMDWIQAKL